MKGMLPVLRKLFYLSAKAVLCSLMIVIVLGFAPLSTLKTAFAGGSGHPYGVTVLAQDWTISNNSSDTGADLQSLGVQWVRIQANEQALENQTNNDTYTWSNSNYNLVNIIQDAVSHGLEVDFPLQWADPQNKPDQEDFSSTGCTSFPTPSAMEDYGLAVAQEFGSEISSIEMGNEEYSPGKYNWNGACGDPQTAATAYSQVASTAYLPIKDACGCKVGMYGITGYVGDNSDLQTYLNDLVGDGVATSIDYYNFHFYTGNGQSQAPGPTTSNPTLNQVIGDFVAAEGKTNIHPIWLTEFGWQTAVNSNCNSSNNVSQQDQANYTADPTQSNTSVMDIMRNNSQTDDTDHSFVYTVEGNDCHSIDPANPDPPFCQNSQQPYCDYPAYTQLQTYISDYPTWP
jgi:hypothetical protein